MPQMAWLFSAAHVDGSKDESFSIQRRGKKISLARMESEKGRMDSGTSRAWIITTKQPSVSTEKLSTARAAMIKRGTAAQGVPVRQKTRCRTR